MRLCFTLVCLVLISCTHQDQRQWEKKDAFQKSRYQQQQDSHPKPVVGDIEDAVPRYEPIKKAGNKSPYYVFGKKYKVLSPASARNYKATGQASWYGMKFHGHKTANGEVYDVHKMTAAHKTLPIPSYVEVTNLENGKKCIVRVNDRGPFKSGRIIDLSYAAAKKIGMHSQGTAQVKVIYLTPTKAPKTAPVFLQIGAYSQKQNAEKLMRKVKQLFDLSTRIKRTKTGVYKVYVGPFSMKQANDWSNRFIQSGFSSPFKVKYI